MFSADDPVGYFRATRRACLLSALARRHSKRPSLTPNLARTRLATQLSQPLSALALPCIHINSFSRFISIPCWLARASHKGIRNEKPAPREALAL